MIATNGAQMGDGWRTDSSNEESKHVPVMLREVMEHVGLRPGDDAIDCTFGGGGYSAAMLQVIAPTGKVLALDRDPGVIAAGRSLQWVREAGNRMVLAQADFRNLRTIAEREGFFQLQAIVADLGLSSLQLAVSDRGFSFIHDGPLDMRFDPTSDAPTAADVIAQSSLRELERMIRTYGEDPGAARIARAIVAARERAAIRTTRALAACIARSATRRGHLHPATRTFQALRIAVNDELGALRAAIPQMLALIRTGGRIAIVSFHSLEDRIVKQQFRAAAASGRFRTITKRPLQPRTSEVTKNPRSRSAKLRVIERISV